MKIYTKPDIMFETFELAENIASCDLISENNQAAYACPILDPESGITIFVQADCTMSPEGFGNICYEVPLDAITVFKS